MNDAQKTVLATAVVAVLIASVFLVPWRVGPSEELNWAPVYRQPMSYVRTYDDTYSREGYSSLNYNDAEIATGVLALEIIGIGVGAWLAFTFAAGSAQDNEDTGPTRESSSTT